MSGQVHRYRITNVSRTDSTYIHYSYTLTVFTEFTVSCSVAILLELALGLMVGMAERHTEVARTWDEAEREADTRSRRELAAFSEEIHTEGTSYQEEEGTQETALASQESCRADVEPPGDPQAAGRQAVRGLCPGAGHQDLSEV
uniref:Uncharacterized protein n=1 Tax=Amorphochlora amoebiformis TaxID=1561963 RepID=A0A7S0DCB5_9EUKA|mmetsp:Transcript_23681/g.37259  ORF Transcript_23681/g.37259 Transcript_23681/m.37259 type:complete len:144 (+) Transcript_23681:45-476(+)